MVISLFPPLKHGFLVLKFLYLVELFGLLVVVVVVIVGASVPIVYQKVTLANASALSGKGLEGWRRTSQDVLSSCIEPCAPP